MNSLFDGSVPPAPETPGQQRDQAYGQIRRLLILQQIPDGTRLCEPEWTERLKVNRTALREAFARLEAEGLIEKGPKKGYFVPVLNQRDVNEVMEVRLMLEGGAIERICRLGLNTPQHLRRMRETIDEMERLVREDYLPGVAQTDRCFHESMITAAGIGRLSVLYARAPLPIFHPLDLSGPQWMANVQQTIDEHGQVLEAILAGKAADARQLLCSHLTNRSLVRPNPSSDICDEPVHIKADGNGTPQCHLRECSPPTEGLASPSGSVRAGRSRRRATG